MGVDWYSEVGSNVSVRVVRASELFVFGSIGA